MIQAAPGHQAIKKAKSNDIVPWRKLHMREAFAVDLATIERIKLAATLLNNLGVAVIVTGFLGPVLGLQVPGNPAGAIILLWLFLGVGAHLAGQRILGELSP